MTERRDYREVERFHLREFLRLRRELDGLPWCYSDKPDLLVGAGASTIGIEHTQIYRVVNGGPPLQAREVLEDRFVSEAWLHYSSQPDAILLNVSVYFDDRLLLHGREVAPQAIKLASAVRQIDTQSKHAGMEDDPQSIEAWRFNRQWPDQFPSVVQHIFYRRVPSKDLELWSSCRSCMVPDLSVIQVQAEFDRKESKVSSYRARCSAIWLLLVADGGSPATYQGVDQTLLDTTYESSFDRAFLLERFSGRLHEVGLRPPTA